MELTVAQQQYVNKLIQEYNDVMDAYEICDIIADVNLREHERLSQEVSKGQRRFRPGPLKRFARPTATIDKIVKPTLAALRAKFTPRQRRNAEIRIFQFINKSKGYSLQDLILSNAGGYDSAIQNNTDPNIQMTMLKRSLRERLVALQNSQIK